jgi:hypothetical protein
MNDAQGPSPLLPHHGQRDPKPPIAPDQARKLLLAFVNGKLLAKGEVLQGDRLMTFSEEPNQSK